MVYSPFDFNEAIGHRKEYIEDRLRDGSPVVGVHYSTGLLLLTIRKTQRKVFEIYDRLLYSAIGNQSDIEAIRIAAIDVAHKEGFDRSPDDVTAQRLVSFALSPPLKKLFGDQFNSPAIIRGIFGELGNTPEEDLFLVINYDGEFSQSNDFAVIAGTQEAEDRMSLWLMGISSQTTREQALDRAIKAWGAGAMESRRRQMKDDKDKHPLPELDETEQLTNYLREELKTSHVEVGVLERNSLRENKFRLMNDDDLRELLKEYS